MTTKIKIIMSDFQTLTEEQFSYLRSLEQEYKRGFIALNSAAPHSITFYGGARIKDTDVSYKEVSKLSMMLAKKKWAVVSGGGPGIMSAAFRGADSVNGETIGFEIDLVEEEPDFPAKTRIMFTHFSARKYLLRQSDILVFAPGGYGTLDELMEILNLIKTNKFPAKPVYLLGKEFWKGIFDWFQETLVEDKKTVPAKFLNIFRICDSAEEIYKSIYSLDGFE